jgi:hypothetical protein
MDARILHRPARGGLLALPYFHRVVFDPAGAGKMLLEFLPGKGTDVAGVVKKDRPGTGRALIECHHAFHAAHYKFWVTDEKEFLLIADKEYILESAGESTKYISVCWFFCIAPLSGPCPY